MNVSCAAITKLYNRSKNFLLLSYVLLKVVRLRKSLQLKTGKMFNQIYHMPKFLQRLRRSYKHHLSNMNFPDCHNIRDLIIDTFCKMRVYRAIKNMNEDIEKKAPSTNRKYKKVVNV